VHFGVDGACVGLGAGVRYRSLFVLCVDFELGVVAAWGVVVSAGVGYGLDVWDVVRFWSASFGCVRCGGGVRVVGVFQWGRSHSGGGFR